MSQKQIFKGKLLNLYVRKQKFPNGYIGKLEIIKHPGAVLIAPFLTKDKIILIKQYRPVINTSIWELPAGTLSKNESQLECAKRELIEEIGYKARTWKKIGFMYPAPGYTTEKITMFRAENLIKVGTRHQPDELIAVKIFSKKAVQRLFKSGKIVDAKTVCSLKFVDIL